jgi:predicted HTH transcriptional regulator
LAAVAIVFPAFLEYLTVQERITMKQAEELTQTPRATLKLRITQLLEDGFILRHRQARGTWYTKKAG